MSSWDSWKVIGLKIRIRANISCGYVNGPVGAQWQVCHCLNHRWTLQGPGCGIFLFPEEYLRSRGCKSFVHNPDMAVGRVHPRNASTHWTRTKDRAFTPYQINWLPIWAPSRESFREPPSRQSRATAREVSRHNRWHRRTRHQTRSEAFSDIHRGCVGTYYTNVPLCFLICSRPEPLIKETFDMAKMKRVSCTLVLDEEFAPDSDIQRFLEDKTFDIYTKRNCWGYTPDNARDGNAKYGTSRTSLTSSGFWLNLDKAR